MNGSFDPSQRVNAVHYEITITAEEVRLGTKKILSTKNIRLEVNIPAGVRTGTTVKLTNAR